MSIHYDAMPPQHRFLRSTAKFAGLFGGIGSGKSHVGCFWALTKALGNPRCLGLIGANSYKQLRDSTLRTFRMLLDHYGISHRYLKADGELHIDGGATILCRSMENFDLLRGAELGWFYLDELRETRLEAWQVVKGRLRSQQVDRREGRVTSSPNGFDWMYDEFVRKPSDPATAEAYRTHEAFFARTEDNTHLPPDYLAALIASYDPLLAEQELGGRFINVRAGRIYQAFDRRVHITEQAELDPGQPLLWSLDFNVTPMTAVIAQLDDHGIRVIGELWLSNTSTIAMCEAFAQWLEDHGFLDGGTVEGAGHAAASLSSLDPRPLPLVPLTVYGDAAGAARSTSGRSDYAIVREFFPTASFRVGASNPPRRDRYNAVNTALRDGRGRVRLRIHPRCRHLIDDIEQSVYQPGTNMPDTSDPLRGHISDALGYLVARVMPAGRAALQVGRW